MSEDDEMKNESDCVSETVSRCLDVVLSTLIKHNICNVKEFIPVMLSIGVIFSADIITILIKRDIKMKDEILDHFCNNFKDHVEDELKSSQLN